MQRHSNKFQSVVKRVRYMNILMQLVMVLRLVMIWTQNYFWYMPDQTGWLSFVVVYQLLAALVPIVVFLFVSAEHVLNALLEGKKLPEPRGATGTSRDFESPIGSPELENRRSIVSESFNHDQETMFGRTALEPVGAFSKFFILRTSEQSSEQD
jgi:hypothetical protein